MSSVSVRPYLYVREIARVDGKPKVISQIYIGSPEKVAGLLSGKERFTVVIDKGMNADDNYAWIDDHSRIHFITTYATYFAQDLAATSLEKHHYYRQGRTYLR